MQAGSKTKHPTRSGSIVAVAGIAALCGVMPVSQSLAQSISAKPDDRFARSVTVDGVLSHLKALQQIAKENGRTRAAGTPGYKASVDYVRSQLTLAGYDVTVQPFDFTLFVEKKPPVLDRITAPPRSFKPGDEINTMEYSGNGNVVGTLVPADGIIIPPTPDPSSASGCKASDFPAETAGNIALVQRGTCDFAVKVRNAADAGAVGVVIFNEGNANFPDRIGPFAGTLGAEAAVPVVAASFAVGQNLFETGGRYRLAVNAGFKTTKTFNVIADTSAGDATQTIVVGAHLDSVPEGPGINDNGSGSATVLEIARQFSIQRIKPDNKVRFAFWGAEEEGLFGSTFYVDSLGPKAIDNIALNLNFDMLGSPNFARLVYDGDGSAGDAGPEGSAEIERVFRSYFKGQGLATQATAFDGRSDYFAFIENGIPAGGLFSGAEEIKTKRQEELFGGRAGAPLDKCYHQSCDTFSNINKRAIRELGRGAAFATYTFATRKQPFVKGSADAIASLARDFKYRGPKLVK